MLSVNVIKANLATVETNGYIIGFSYGVPVLLEQKSPYKLMRTAQKWSQTTSRHITELLKLRPEGLRVAEIVEQDVINCIVATL